MDNETIEIERFKWKDQIANLVMELQRNQLERLIKNDNIENLKKQLGYYKSLSEL